MKLESIGRVRSPYIEQRGTPIQPAFGEEPVEIFVDPQYRGSLADLDGFERVWIVTWLDRAGEYRPRVVPYRDTVERGLFATRSPCRPNPIGLSCVRLLSVDLESGVIRIESADLLDGTPVLDIKPYLPRIDAHSDSRDGWFGESRVRRERADGRFERDAEESSG